MGYGAPSLASPFIPSSASTSTPKNASPMLPTVTRDSGCLSRIMENRYVQKLDVAYIVVTASPDVKLTATNQLSAGTETSTVSHVTFVNHCGATCRQLAVELPSWSAMIHRKASR
jgi:hypothetical protein